MTLTTTLSILENELPDPNEDLFVNFDSSNSLTQFTPFPNLPKEIRLKIFRFIFPAPRNIPLYHAMYGEWQFNEGARWYRYSMPVTLYLNRESREETHRHFIFVCPTWDWKNCRWNDAVSERLPLYRRRWPTVVNRVQDRVVVKWQQWSYQLRPSQWTDASTGRDPCDVFGKIKIIDIREVSWWPDTKEGYEEAWNNLEYLVRGLIHLRCSERVFLTGHCTEAGWIGTPEGKEDIKRTFEAALEEEYKATGCFVKGMIPEIVVRDWTPIGP